MRRWKRWWRRVIGRWIEMDPNANLQEQERILELGLVADYARLWELRQALDRWLEARGSEPDWLRAPRAARYYGR